jgi:hypothetical protein
MNQIYFNHVPRTGGRFLIKYIKDSKDAKVYFVNNNKNINIKEYNNCNIIYGHLGIEPNILFKDVLTITILRDPIKRFISHYTYFINQYTKTNPNKSLIYNFNEWLFNDSLDYFIKDNLMTKFFTNTRSNVSDNGVSLALSFQKNLIGKNRYSFKGLEDKKTDVNSAKKYLDNCKLIILNEKILDQENMIKDFFQTNNIYLNNINNIKNHFVFNNSNEIYKNLNNLQLEKIQELTKLDLDVYNYAKEIVDKNL